MTFHNFKSKGRTNKGRCKLHLGYFEHFRGPDTILFSGDEDGLQRLAGVLRCLENPNARSP